MGPLSDETTKQQSSPPPRLTFHPVALVEVDLSLGLGGVRTNHHKVSARDGAVQLPSGAYSLAVTAGADGEREREGGAPRVSTGG